MSYKVASLRAKFTLNPSQSELKNELLLKCKEFRSAALKPILIQIESPRLRFGEYRTQADMASHLRSISIRPPWWRSSLRTFKRLEMDVYIKSLKEGFKQTCESQLTPSCAVKLQVPTATYGSIDQIVTQHVTTLEKV